jgi:GDP-4-dehydro-6-deoxy-D-mannose reductase
VKKVLITGIEGFVGTHLADYLHNREYKVTGIHFAQPVKRFGKLYQCDIRQYAAVLKIIRTIKPDVIFHLAAQSSVAEGEKTIKQTFAVNVQGTLNILEAINALNIKARIIYISSCEVYGQSNKKLTEQSQTKPVSFYAMSKLCAEQVCLYYQRTHNLDVVLLRPFSHTGPGQAEHFIFPRIAKQVAEIEAGLIEPVLKLGNIKVRRDYSDVQDIITAYELASRKCQSGEIYNITAQKPYSIRQGVEFLIKLSSQKIAIEIDKKLVRKNDISLLTGSARKFMRDTGWKPAISFQTTLSNLLNYYRTKTER